METLELFYPQIAARAGPYELDAGIEFEIFSAKSSYFDWAKIRFTEQFQPEISLARKDPAAIELGYNGVMEEVFTGFVSRPYNYGGGADEITLKDEMLLLEDTQINNTFLDTTPQEVISYVLAQAGISKKKLNAQGWSYRQLAEKFGVSSSAIGRRAVQECWHGTDAQRANARLRNLAGDRKSTRLNSSHLFISYAVFCVIKKNMVVVLKVLELSVFQAAVS